LYKNNKIIDFNSFPTTRYQGSKRKILPWIYDKIKDLKFESCLDAFGGTASVSYLLKKMGKRVTYNDKLKFNYLIGKALIENQNFILLEKDIKKLTLNNFYCNTVQNNFKDIYFLNNENKWIDKISGNIIHMNNYFGKELEFKKAIAYYALFQSCLIKRPFNLFHRKNLNLRLNNVKRNFGNKTSWDKPFEFYFHRFINDANQLIFDSKKICKSINKSAFDIEGDYDLVYLDPPYINKNVSNETSNYLKCYHFLEGLADYNEWPNYIDKNSLNNSFINRNEFDFHSLNISETYEKLFFKFKKSIIVLSYKKNGKPSIEHFIKLMKKFKNNVYTFSKHYTYALNHQNGDKINNREIIIIGV
jgi:adenine-specific DNA-methyltransferase